MNEELLESYLKDELADLTTFDERLSLLFLVLGLKPGALILGVKRGQEEMLEEFAEDFDLGIKLVNGEKRPLRDKILRRDERTFKDVVFLARDPERFDMLKQEDPGFAGFTHRSVGKFLGYPDSALEYYSETYAPGSEFMDELEEATLEKDELRFLNFLSYVPSTRDDQLKEAIKEGKRRAEYLERKSDEAEIYSEYRKEALEMDVV